MFASLHDLESHVSELIAIARYSDAIANMLVGVHNHNRLSIVNRKVLYYPGLDRQIQKLADALVVGVSPSMNLQLSYNTLIVASEIYQVGGHSRVIIDIVKEARSPIVVLTDMLWRFRKEPHHLDWFIRICDNATVIVLPQLTAWDKCQGLKVLTDQFQPSNILYFNHPEDPIPFVGTLGHKGSRKTLVHHNDHTPSLGSTLIGVHHVDFVEEMAETCARHLDRDALVLPLYVEDSGVKTFTPVHGNLISAVTSGTHIKYAREGKMALQGIVQTVLNSLGGSFFHIGELSTEWVSEIRAHLLNVGLEPERFVILGQVPSVWKAIERLDAHIYIGSAPVGGGRAAIEAQGCGYPLAFFRVDDQGPAIGSDSLYASKQLGWSNLSELTATIMHVMSNHSELSSIARAHYEKNYSRAEFNRILSRIIKFNGEASVG